MKNINLLTDWWDPRGGFYGLQDLVSARIPRGRVLLRSVKRTQSIQRSEWNTIVSIQEHFGIHAFEVGHPIVIKNQYITYFPPIEIIENTSKSVTSTSNGYLGAHIIEFQAVLDLRYTYITVAHHALQDWGLICFKMVEYWAKSIVQSLLGIIGDWLILSLFSDLRLKPDCGWGLLVMDTVYIVVRS